MPRVNDRRVALLSPRNSIFYNSTSINKKRCRDEQRNRRDRVNMEYWLSFSWVRCAIEWTCLILIVRHGSWQTNLNKQQQVHACPTLAGGLFCLLQTIFFGTITRM